MQSPHIGPLDLRQKHRRERSLESLTRSVYRHNSFPKHHLTELVSELSSKAVSYQSSLSSSPQAPIDHPKDQIAPMRRVAESFASFASSRR
jgi:hypothetical protein